MNDERYVDDQGWSVDCILVQPGKEKSVWSLVVKMDPDKEDKQSHIFHCADFDAAETVEAYRTQTWLSSFWRSPTDTIFACDGFRLWTGRPGGDFTEQAGLSDRQILKVWGFDDRRRFILGEGGLVLRSDGDAWADISLHDGRRLVDISGPSEEIVYACGHGGAFCRLNGNLWEIIDIGTDANIRGLCVLPDGSVYGCGERGIAFLYRDGNVQFFDAPPDRYFGGVALFQGKVYFGASGDGVDILDGNEVVPFKTTIFGQRLSFNERYLWSCGGNSVFRFDGKDWTGEDFL